VSRGRTSVHIKRKTNENFPSFNILNFEDNNSYHMLISLEDVGDNYDDFKFNYMNNEQELNNF